MLKSKPADGSLMVPYLHGGNNLGHRDLPKALVTGNHITVLNNSLMPASTFPARFIVGRKGESKGIAYSFNLAN